MKDPEELLTACRRPGQPSSRSSPFGQAMPARLLEKAFEAAERADLAISLGSTLSVEPAASVPRRAAQRGVPYVIINFGATSHDSLATVRLEG